MKESLSNLLENVQRIKDSQENVFQSPSKVKAISDELISNFPAAFTSQVASNLADLRQKISSDVQVSPRSYSPVIDGLGEVLNQVPIKINENSAVIIKQSDQINKLEKDISALDKQEKEISALLKAGGPALTKYNLAMKKNSEAISAAEIETQQLQAKLASEMEKYGKMIVKVGEDGSANEKGVSVLQGLKWWGEANKAGRGTAYGNFSDAPVYKKTSDTNPIKLNLLQIKNNLDAIEKQIKLSQKKLETLQGKQQEITRTFHNELSVSKELKSKKIDVNKFLSLVDKFSEVKAQKKQKIEEKDLLQAQLEGLKQENIDLSQLKNKGQTLVDGLSVDLNKHILQESIKEFNSLSTESRKMSEAISAFEAKGFKIPDQYQAQVMIVRGVLDRQDKGSIPKVEATDESPKLISKTFAVDTLSGQLRDNNKFLEFALRNLKDLNAKKEADNSFAAAVGKFNTAVATQGGKVQEIDALLKQDTKLALSPIEMAALQNALESIAKQGELVDLTGNTDVGVTQQRTQDLGVRTGVLNDNDWGKVLDNLNKQQAKNTADDDFAAAVGKFNTAVGEKGDTVKQIQALLEKDSKLTLEGVESAALQNALESIAKQGELVDPAGNTDVGVTQQRTQDLGVRTGVLNDNDWGKVLDNLNKQQAKNTADDGFAAAVGKFNTAIATQGGKVQEIDALLKQDTKLALSPIEMAALQNALESIAKQGELVDPAGNTDVGVTQQRTQDLGVRTGVLENTQWSQVLQNLNKQVEQNKVKPTLTVVQPKPMLEIIEPKPPSNMLFGLSSLRQRADKIGAKGEGQLRISPIQNAGWSEYVKRSEEHINKLASLAAGGDAAIQSQYNAEKLKSDGSVKYSAEERLDHANVKSKLYEGWRVQKVGNIFDSNAFELQRKADRNDNTANNYETMATVRRNVASGKIDIVSAKDEPDGGSILMMLTQAHSAARATGNKTINISNCEDTPQTALLMQELAKRMGLEPKLSKSTDEAVKQFKQENPNYTLDSDPKFREELKDSRKEGPAADAQRPDPSDTNNPRNFKSK